MRPFNLEDAKNGVPVCTRDGRSARIVCFDANRARKILALCYNADTDSEFDITCYENGKVYNNITKYPCDLFMVPDNTSINKPIFIYTYGSRTRGKEVIKLLEEKGGVNSNKYNGESILGAGETLYYISAENVICRVCVEYLSELLDILAKFFDMQEIKLKYNNLLC